MALKSSKHNFFFTADDGYILAYNSLSNSLARLTPEKYQLAKSVLDTPNALPPYDKEALKMCDDLRKGSFLVEAELDELELLKMRNKSGRFSGDVLGLTIAPTLACNFRCTYCFEDQRPESMTLELETALAAFVEKHLETAGKLHITWFGGEPTLKMDTIERLCLKFAEICRAKNVVFPEMSIVTNGYLLTPENARKLKTLNITHAQVTLDGPKEIHNRRRLTVGGEGSFQRVIENIKAAKDIIKINIRINVDKENVDHMDALMEDLKTHGLAETVPFYFAQVQEDAGACSDLSTVCFSSKEHSALVVRLLKKAREKGIGNIRYPHSIQMGYCGAEKRLSFVVSPTGDLFKCWQEVSSGPEYSVGSIFPGVPSAVQVMNQARYLNWDPFENEDCRECKFVPICAGGCPFLAFRAEDKKNCTDYKYNLHEMLRMKYARMMDQTHVQTATLQHKGDKKI